jgi:hypothetical protein
MGLLGRKQFRGWIAVTIGLVVCCGSLSLGAVQGQAATPAAEPISVTAKLVEIPTSLPPDDLYDYAYVMRYEVIGGPLDKATTAGIAPALRGGATILVAHYKPLQPRSKIKDKMKEHVGGKLRSFVVGDVHKLKLAGDLKKIWKGPLVDEFAATDRKSTRYWCLQVDPG